MVLSLVAGFALCAADGINVKQQSKQHKGFCKIYS